MVPGQALGLAVGMKYERAYGDGADVANLRVGATLPRLFQLLEQSTVPAVDRVGLLRWAIFQVLIGNTDAHAKNLSFFCDAHGLRLAPAYDLVCMEALDAGLRNNYAMAIGDAFTEADLSPCEWARFAHLCRLPFRLVGTELERVASRIMAAMDDLLAQTPEVPQDVARRFRDAVLATCQRQIAHGAQVKRFKVADFA